MTMHARWTSGAAALFFGAASCCLRGCAGLERARRRPNLMPRPVAQPAAAKAGAAPDARQRPAPPPTTSTQAELPPRVPFTAAEDAVAGIPGMPDARFWADSDSDFNNALPPQPGPWLVLSSGGEDGAFGAGLLSGLTAAGKRPDYAVVTGVSTGALMAPFVFAGPRYDDALRNGLYQGHGGRYFRSRHTTGESFVDSVAAQRPDRQRDYAGSCWPISPRRIAAAGVCLSSPPISMPNARWSGTWAQSPRMAAKMRSSCSATCCWPRPPSPALSRRC